MKSVDGVPGVGELSTDEGSADNQGMDLAPAGPSKGETTLRFETRIHGETVHVVRDGHTHWITSSQEPRQRAYVLNDHYTSYTWPKPAGSTSRWLTLTIYHAVVDGIKHPQKILDEKGREWTLSDDMRCYITEELRREDATS